MVQCLLAVGRLHKLPAIIMQAVKCILKMTCHLHLLTVYPSALADLHMMQRLTSAVRALLQTEEGALPCTLFKVAALCMINCMISSFLCVNVTDLCVHLDKGGAKLVDVTALCCKFERQAICKVCIVRIQKAIH